MEIRTIQIETDDYRQMLQLRMDVLLHPIGIPPHYINQQKEKEDTLIGAFDGGRLIGCCILTKIDTHTLQLRQMAIHREAQGRGVGKSIVCYAEALAVRNGYDSVMMHSRDNAVGFYEKCGYKVEGDAFEEVGIRHYKMVKHLG